MSIIRLKNGIVKYTAKKIICSNFLSNIIKREDLLLRENLIRDFDEFILKIKNLIINYNIKNNLLKKRVYEKRQNYIMHKFIINILALGIVYQDYIEKESDSMLKLALVITEKILDIREENIIYSRNLLKEIRTTLGQYLEFELFTRNPIGPIDDRLKFLKLSLTNNEPQLKITALNHRFLLELKEEVIEKIIKRALITASQMKV
jgi:hypothetical protein